MRVTVTKADIAIPVTAAAEFNRYLLTYSATVPLRASIRYTEDGETRTEEFFLEAGENVTFASYIDSYLRHGLASEAAELTFRTITHGEGELTLQGFSVETHPVLAEQTFYFENERYRVGVELCWGGGLSYLEDKKCPVAGLVNILNNADTGRLIQQSYYGTGDPPYVRGEFMGNSWGYNPVQGGDRGNNKSKLVDARITEGEVYVKCRPRDWGHDGGTTYSYMENWYRLDGDFLHVDNRFVDFSGWTHPRNTQEVPAFYTVSYLNNYYWYDGDKPWTDDTLSVKSDLPFWPEDWPYCTFKPKGGNTELWSAFVDDGGYGLGLFTPNITHTIAGRHAYDGSKDPAAGSCGYIAPLKALALKCFVPVTYAYLITAGTLEEIRARFKACKDEITNEAWDRYGE